MVLLLVGTAFAGENENVVLSVDISSIAVPSDSPTQVTLTVSVEGATNVSGFGVEVTFDPDAVSVVGGDVGAFMPAGAVNPGLDVATPGKVGVGAAILGGKARLKSLSEADMMTFTR